MSLSRSLSGVVQTLVKTVTGKDRDALLWKRDLVVPAEEIAKEVDKRLAELRAKSKLPGFRKGKAPLEVVRSRYGEAAWAESLGDVVIEKVQSAIEEENLRPASNPEIEIRKMAMGEDVEITVVLDLLPELDLEEIKALKVERPVVRNIDGIVESQLAQTAKEFPVTVPVEEARPAAVKDIVRVDISTFASGKQIGEKQEDVWIEIGENALDPGADPVEYRLVGSRPGDRLSVEMPPSPAGNDEIVLEIEVHGLEQRAEDEETSVDDAFARRAGAENLENLRSLFSEKIRERCDVASRMVAGTRALNALVAAHPVSVAERTLARYAEAWHRQAVHNAGGHEHELDHGHTHDHDHDHDHDHHHGHGDSGTVVKDEDPARAALVGKVAQAQATLDKLVHAVADANKIVVLRQEAVMVFVQTGGLTLLGMEPKKFAREYGKNPERYDSFIEPIYRRLIREKVVDWLLENVRLEETEMSEEDLDALLRETKLDYQALAAPLLGHEDEMPDGDEPGESAVMPGNAGEGGDVGESEQKTERVSQ